MNFDYFIQLAQGNQSFLIQFFKAFQSEFMQDVESLELANTPIEKFQALHKIKNKVSMLGLDTLTEEVIFLEKQCKLKEEVQLSKICTKLRHINTSLQGHELKLPDH